MGGVSDDCASAGLTLLLLPFITSAETLQAEINGLTFLVDGAFGASDLGTPSDVPIAEQANLRSKKSLVSCLLAGQDLNSRFQISGKVYLRSRRSTGFAFGRVTLD